MATFAPEFEKKSFAPHPKGKFSAVLCDVYQLEEKNYWFGKRDPKGELDTRETVKKLYLVFLTEHKVKIGDDVKPAWIREGFSFSLGDNSKLGKTLRSWLPSLAEVDDLYAEFRSKPFDVLIGAPAFIEVVHRENKNDPKNPYTSIASIAELPKFNPSTGELMSHVVIPDDFKRGDVARLQANATKKIQESHPTWRQAAQNTHKHTQKAKDAANDDAGCVVDDDLPF